MALQVVVNAFPNGVDYTQRSVIVSGTMVLTAQTYTPGGAATITAFSISSNVVTFTASKALRPGSWWVFQGWGLEHFSMAKV